MHIIVVNTSEKTNEHIYIIQRTKYAVLEYGGTYGDTAFKIN